MNYLEWVEIGAGFRYLLRGFPGATGLGEHGILEFF
jgi:hypothetical protein